ncbi:MAG: hypothetical protein IJ301_01725 [Clostridia bacterium]|nr:hypothetical protein [Clostridia bacterium]
MPRINHFYRNISSAKIELVEHISRFKFWYILLGGLALLGVVIGIITGFSIAPDASVSKIPDSIFQNYLQDNTSIFGVFFARIFSIIAMLGIILVTNFRPFLCFLNMIFLIYRGFVVGATLSLLIVLFNVGGILNVVFIVIPCHFTILIGLVIWSVVCMGYNVGSHDYGGCVFSRDFVCTHKQSLCVSLLICFVAVVLEMLLLPWLTSAIIIGS